MMLRRLSLILVLPAIAAVSATLQADPVFNRIATFAVIDNLPAAQDPAAESSAEIIAATADGQKLIYTDSPLGGVGLIDIRNPENPIAAGFLPLAGEPTSVAVHGNQAWVAINTSADYVDASGYLVQIDLAGDLQVDGPHLSCELPGQPDSIAIDNSGTRVAVAIENERDEDLNDGVLPQLPAGALFLVSLSDGRLDCDTSQTVALTGLAAVGETDPEPEFVDFNDAGQVVVTLQENNHLVVVDPDGSVAAHYSAGSVDLTGIDTEEQGALQFDNSLEAVAREPDAVKWLDNSRFVTANEGDYVGGSRGFSIFDAASGDVLYDSGTDFEYRVIAAGHYPENRSGNKGVEPEGLAVGRFGDHTYIFVLAERASVVGVYRDTGAAPEFVQLLPTALAPEGAVALPEQGLLAVASEADLVEDGGVRSHVTLYRLDAGTARYPMLVSEVEGDAVPLGWGALSGLVADPATPARLYAVNDSFYALQPRIFTIDAASKPARIVDAVTVTRGGQPAQLLDLEGITTDGEGGFWLISEGRQDRLVPHALYQVDSNGEILKQVPFPAELLAVQERFAGEGITRVDKDLWIALQRPWQDDPDDHVKLLRYAIDDEIWQVVHYPLDTADTGWIGLSEITFDGDALYLIERDNQIAAAAALKRLYRVDLEGLQPVALSADPPVVSKTLVHDFLPDLRAGHGYVLDKLEGFAIDVNGTGFAVTDNDGVDDSNGETRFFAIDLDRDS